MLDPDQYLKKEDPQLRILHWSGLLIPPPLHHPPPPQDRINMLQIIQTFLKVTIIHKKIAFVLNETSFLNLMLKKCILMFLNEIPVRML
jgi:hypothetical protein